MRWMTSFILLAVGALALFALYVRLAPSDPACWHADPLTATDPGSAGFLRRPASDDPGYALEGPALLAAFDTFVTGQTRVTRLAGTPDSGRITYIARSRLWGFPDYISVAAVETESGGADLAIYSRLRFGAADLGVNQRRIEAWLSAFEPSS